MNAEPVAGRARAALLRGTLIAALLVIAAVCMLGVAGLAWGIVYGLPIRYTDATFARAMQGFRFPAAVSAMALFTHLGDTVWGLLLTAGIGAWLWWRGRREDAVYVVGATLTAILFNTAVKEIVYRTRPSAMLAAVPLPISPSFPSGHAVFGIVLFGTLAVAALSELGLTWKGLGLAAALCLVGVLLGWSRLYLGVHWVTDVVGGWMVGTAWVALWTAGLVVYAGSRDAPE